VQKQKESALRSVFLFSSLSSTLVAISAFSYGLGASDLGLGFLGLALTGLLETAFSVLATAAMPASGSVPKYDYYGFSSS